MSRYIVTSGSHFDPFTYDELAKPLVQATEAHNAAADAYGKISMETEALRQYITNNPGDRGAKATYDTYVNQLQALQKDLWDKGLTASTRQQLAEARDLYAGQVMPIATAIQNRQQRSADYWKMRREHPDMIMGEDPGISGLDDYVSNPNFGQDYYTYSGDQFAKEVAADAKARADELLRDIEGRLDVDNDSELAGYLRAIKQNGFTSGEVARAYDAVVNGADLNSLNVPEKILAEVLVSHLNSTGARGKVSPDEYSRLMDYGRQGLSEAIGKTDIQYLQDQQWQLNKQKELARYQASLKTPKGGKEKPPKGGEEQPARKNGYILNQMLYNTTAPGYSSMAKAHEKVDKRYSDSGGNVVLNLPNGGSKPIASSDEMMEEVFNPEIRKAFREQTGLDIALPVATSWTSKRKKELYTGHNLDGEPVSATRLLTASEAAELGLTSKDVAVTKEDGSVDKDMTVAYNRARKLYNQYVDNYRKANPDFDLDDYVYRTPKEEAKYRMNEGIENGIDSGDLDDVESIKNRVMAETTPVTIASTEPSHEMARSVFGASLGAELVKNGDAKNALHMYYDVAEDGLTKGKKGDTALDGVFPATKDASGKMVYNTDALLYVHALPEDILAGAGKGRPMVRFATTISGGEKMTDASNFGSYLYNSLKQAQPALPSWSQVTNALGIKAPEGANPNAHMSICDATYYLMLPFERPEEVLKMSDEQAMAWSQLMYQLINDEDSDDFRGPVIWNGDQPIPVSAKDIVRNSEFQDALYDGIKEFQNDYMSIVRDDLTQRHMRNIGNQSDKASRYITVK